MGLFEENPLLAVPLIVVVVAGYDAVKWWIKRLILSHESLRRR
jgi:hypothetical protein